MDSQNLSLEDEKKLYLNSQASNVLMNALREVSLFPYLSLWSALELLTMIQDKYDVSNIIKDDCIVSTSGRDEFSCLSTSPMCGKKQGNDMVTGVDIELTIDDPSSLSHCNAL
jgi:hypothetical protein